jgi:hypothetical protein
MRSLTKFQGIYCEKLQSPPASFSHAQEFSIVCDNLVSSCREILDLLCPLSTLQLYLNPPTDEVLPGLPSDCQSCL